MLVLEWQNNYLVHTFEVVVHSFDWWEFCLRHHDQLCMTFGCHSTAYCITKRLRKSQGSQSNEHSGLASIFEITVASIYIYLVILCTCLYLYLSNVNIPVYFTFVISVSVLDVTGLETESAYSVEKNNQSVMHLTWADTQIFMSGSLKRIRFYTWIENWVSNIKGFFPGDKYKFSQLYLKYT